MSEVFFPTFTAIFTAIFRLFIIIFFAGLLVRKNIITEEQVKGVSHITVTILLPCLIFSKIIEMFDPSILPFWWVIPLAGISMIFAGVFLGWILFVRELPSKNNMLALTSMMNAIYLILPIGQMVYPDNFDEFSLYCFLFTLGFNPLMWSLGKYLATSSTTVNGNIKEFITVPLVSSIVSVMIVLTGTDIFIPDAILDSVDLIGSATIPIATLILGATLGGISLNKWPSIMDSLRVNAVKFVFLPVITIGLLHLFGVKESYPILADMLVMQSSSPPATALILQVTSYGGDSQKMGSMMMINYSVAIFIMPFWLGLWHML